MQASQHPNTCLASIELSNLAYRAYPKSEAILFYEIQSFDEMGRPSIIQQFITFNDEKQSYTNSYEDSLKMANTHANATLSPDIIKKGIRVCWVNWAVTFPWERKRHQDLITEMYNNQDVTSQISNQGVNLLPWGEDMDLG